MSDRSAGTGNSVGIELLPSPTVGGTNFSIGDKRMADFGLVLVDDFAGELLVIFRLDEDPLVLEIVIKLVGYIHRATHSPLNCKLNLALATVPRTRRTIPTRIIRNCYCSYSTHINKHSNSNRQKNNQPKNKTYYS